MKITYSLMALVLAFAGRGEGSRDILSVEPVAGLPKVGYPGPRPFRGTEELIVTAEPPLTGDVTLTLTEGRKTGKALSFVASGGRVMRFRTALDPSGWYRFSSIDGMSAPRRWTLKGVFRQTAAEAARLGVETGNPLHVSRGADEPVVLTLHNPSDRSLAWRGVLEIRDFWEQGFDLSLDRAVGAGETVRFPLSRGLKKGYWHVLMRLTGEDGSVSTNETSFAVLDRHVVTPYVPYGTFRMGLNYHFTGYNEQDKALTLEALTACGAKLVRCGIALFGQVCARGPDSWNWKESDRLLELLESRGLALDVIVYSTPPWARRSERDVPARYATTVPPRHGLLGRFCREVTARYGMRIDYYEIGNEWDLRKPEVLTIDEAIELQKEAYAGAKAGCPQARVIPNGWALASSDHPMISQKGFQERVMKEAKGYYDVHPVHIHGRFPYFAERLRNGFFAFREKIGIATVPWYANETALSSAYGAEKAAAEAVFKKILWSQACGSTDYIWYNLRATGWDPADGEQGYGLITADYHPRASYAVFSALTTLYGGLTADGVCASERGRYVMRFSGKRDGMQLKVLSFWDERAMNGVKMRVATDASAAQVVDLMGNAVDVSICDGMVIAMIGASPSSMVLFGATRAEPNKEDLRSGTLHEDSITVPDTPPESRGADLVLNVQSQVEELWKANPVTEHRIWKGSSDLSAEVRLAKLGNDLRILVDVTDDHDVLGDGALQTGDGLALALAPTADGQAREWRIGRLPDGHAVVRQLEKQEPEACPCSIVRKDGRTLYDVTMPNSLSEVLPKSFYLGLRVLEDDGDGRDGWLAPMAPEDPSRRVHVTIEPLRQWY